MNKILQLEIPKRAKKCAKGEEEFASGDFYFSILVDHEEKGFSRSDFCVSCWDKAKSERGQPIDTYWKSKVSFTPSKNIELHKSRDERALDLLKQAVQDDSLENQENAFLLALYLARRRLLALRKEKKKEGVHLCIYEVMETEEMLCVKKIQIQSDRIAKAQERLAGQLKSHSV